MKNESGDGEEVSSTERVQFFHISRPNWVSHAAEAVVFDMLLLANSQRPLVESFGLVGAPFVACLVLLRLGGVFGN